MKVGEILLDTNAVVFLTRSDPEIVSVLMRWDKYYVPSVVLGELFYGAFKSTRIKQNLELIEEIMLKYTVLDKNAETAREFGKLKADLRAKGRPIPDNDIWISAVALQYGLPLLTRDKHFDVVSDLQVVTW